MNATSDQQCFPILPACISGSGISPIDNTITNVHTECCYIADGQLARRTANEVEPASAALFFAAAGRGGGKGEKVFDFTLIFDQTLLRLLLFPVQGREVISWWAHKV